MSENEDLDYLHLKSLMNMMDDCVARAQDHLTEKLWDAGALTYVQRQILRANHMAVKIVMAINDKIELIQSKESSDKEQKADSAQHVTQNEQEGKKDSAVQSLPDPVSGKVKPK